MNWFDLVLLLVLAASILRSFRKGLTREVVSLLSVVVAIVLGIELYGTAGAILLPYVSTPAAAHFAGFFLVFFGVLLLGGVVSHILGRFWRVTGLSFVDHILGAGFGAVRGLLVGVALITGFMAFSPGSNPPDAVVRSRIAPYVIGGAQAVAAVAPHELKEGFRRTYAGVKDAWDKALEQKALNERKI